MSPERDLLTSAIKQLYKLKIPVFEDFNSDSNQLPQIIVSVDSSSPNQRAKNEDRYTYYLNIDYVDELNIDHGKMLDTCYLIKRMIRNLQLSEYSMSCTSDSNRETKDSSTSRILRRKNFSFRFEIQEQIIY